MADARFEHKLDHAALMQLLTGPKSGVMKDLVRRAILVESAAKRNLRRDPKRVNTGRLGSSLTWRTLTFQGRPAIRIGTNVEYALFVHEGTGLYGPKHKMIVPVNKKVLRWKNNRRGGKGKKSGYTYSMKSRGMRPNPFLKDALKAAKY